MAGLLDTEVKTFEQHRDHLLRMAEATYGR
jgi:hypothetical protein